MEQLGLTESTTRHYREEGLSVILRRHYDSGTECYSDELVSQLIAERRSQYEQGIIDRTSYQNLRKAAAMLREFRQTGKITLERLPDWGRSELTPQFKSILNEFCSYVMWKGNLAENSISAAKSVAHICGREARLRHDDSGVTERPSGLRYDPAYI